MNRKDAATLPASKTLPAAGLLTAFLASAAWLAGCHSYHIEMTVDNRTGGQIQLLEVDYPSASFGSGALAANGSMHYRVQLRGSGQLSVQYMTADRQQVQIKGPQLAEGQEGSFEIVLEAAGKAEFHPHLR